MISRRKLLGGLAAGAAVGSGATLLSGHANGSVLAPRSKAAAGLALTIANKTGSFDNASVWVYIVGNEGGRQVRVTPDGTLAPIALSDNGDDGFTDYAIPLAGSGDTQLTLPKMSGRIYVALGDKLKFKAVEGGDGSAALAYPAGWVESDPNYEVLHDCAEFTYNDGGMYCNTTMVDMFSVPLDIHLTGAKDQKAGELKEGARAKIFSDLAGVEGYDKLVVGDKRVIAPGHGLDTGIFAEDYFAPAIDEVWSHYASADLKVTTNAGTFTGRVSGDQFAFTGPAEVSFAKPTTRDVLFCDGNLAAPNDGTTGPVAAILGAGFNRATLLSQAEQPSTDPATFYQEQIANHYARVMHEASADGKAYGFAFDDVAGFASYIEDGAPESFTLTLGAV
ncbi:MULTISPECIES: beta-1,3-glucanase family protein [Streptomyces]|uniref:Glycosyl hydrolase n=1 Tax=Streptomyces lycii TaxID=2654337 RepID=A0ABQ7FFD6_9ACTN|nr:MULTISPECIES: beta-1,3-glucanase family protein [Streptomyces]KAF4407350.1 glycosyl hydrolase [Streptomyces lycii]PGH51097.1 glycosyl hydrolase [Streptomyces sp. Ru87]